MSLVSSIDIATALQSALAALTFTPAVEVTVELLPRFRPKDTETPRVVLRPVARSLSRVTRLDVECAHQIRVDVTAKLGNGDGEAEASALLQLGESICAAIYSTGDVGGGKLVSVVQDGLADSEEIASLRQISTGIVAEYRSWGTP